MPHVVFNLGTLAATTEAVARPLIPGVEPGMGIHNIFAQQRMKRALLIQDAWVEPIDINVSGGAGYNAMSYFLKLSQEQDMTPGLQLPVGVIGADVREADATGRHTVGVGAALKDLFKAHGTIWAPRFAGIRAVEAGAVSIDADVHVDYEVVEVPWERWFVMWDYLDNVVDNTVQY